MKFKSILMSALCLFGAAMTGCDNQDDATYEPVGSDSDKGVYFSNEQSSQIDLEENQQSFVVKVLRTNAAKAETVQVNMETADAADASLFTAPATVTFEEGQTSTEMQVGIDFNALKADKEYVVTFSIPGEGSSPYGDATKAFALKYAPWSPWTLMKGDGIYTYTVYWELEDPEVPVYTRHSLVDPTHVQYQAGSVGMPGVPTAQQYGMAYGVNYTFDVQKEGEKYYVTMLPTTTLYTNPNYNEEVWATDLYTYCSQIKPGFQGDMSLEEVKEMSTFNPETGLIKSHNVYYISLGSFGNGYEYLQLPGYPDYTVSAQTNGHYVTDGGDELQVINIFLAKDVASAKYNIFEGKLKAQQIEQAAEIVMTSEDSKELKESGNITVQLDNGDYTIVVVGLDAAGNKVSTGYLTFTFTSVKVDVNAGWTSRGFVTYGEDYFASTFQGLAPLTYTVEIQEMDDEPGIYRLVDPYGAAWPMFGASSNILPTANHNYLVINAQDPEAIYVETSDIKYEFNGDPMYLGSLAGNNIAGGATHEQVKQAGMCGTFANGLMTMPVKSLLTFIGNSGYYANTNGGFKVDFNDEGEEEEAMGRIEAHKQAKAAAARMIEKAPVAKRVIARNIKSLDSKAFNAYVSKRAGFSTIAR